MMYLAMYKGPAQGWLHRISHWAVCLWTRSEYSHCELVFGEPDRFGASLCASSSARDGGVRFKSICLGNGHWDVYVLDGFDAFEEAFAYDWFSEYRGKGYDWLGLLWFLLPVKAINQPKRYFCSEAVASALQLRAPHKQHPQRLLEAVLKV